LPTLTHGRATARNGSCEESQRNGPTPSPRRLSAGHQASPSRSLAKPFSYR